MISYLLGGLAAAIASAVALWFKSRYEKVKGQKKLLEESYENLGKTHRLFIAKSTENRERMLKELSSVSEERDELREKVRTLLIKSDDPAFINDELNELFPVG